MCSTRLGEIQDAKRTQKIGHLRTIAQLCRAISSQLRHASTIRKTLLNSNISSTCPHNMVNFGPLTAENGWRFGAGILFIHVRGHLPPNGILRSPVLAVLLHRTGALGVSQTLRHGTKNGIMELSLLTIVNRGRHLYSEGGHHVWHRPTF